MKFPTSIIIKILTGLLGKNAAHIARKVQTFIGGILISSVLFTTPIDAGIDVDPGFNPITATEIEDGLTVGELLRVAFGFVLVIASRVMSYLRARKLDFFAEWVGIIVGRSFHSLIRAGLTVFAALLSWAGMTDNGVGVSDSSLVNILVAMFMLVVSGISSKFLDSKPNPVETSPDKNLVFGK